MTDPSCICPHGVRTLGRLYGASMGKGVVRLRLESGCPVHDPATHEFVDPYPDGPPSWHVPPLLCMLCHVPRRQHM